MPASPPPAPDPALLDRLARLGVRVGVTTSDKRDGAPSGGAGRHPAKMPIESAVPGRVWESLHGQCYVADVTRGRSDEHAGESLDAVERACTESLAGLSRDPRLSGVDLEAAAFVDTETTGLVGGTGTYAFLIGIGRFEGPSFVVRQFFMRDPSEEAAQLAAAREWLDGVSLLVSFNGRAYDLPLLSTRYSLNGLSNPLSGRPDLDLLHAARRLWRRRLPSCALTSLERHVLGLERFEDVPGWLIPHRYFTYQRDGDARGLVGIFKHNALDVLSMVTLTARLAELYRAPQRRVKHGQDWASLAKAYEAAGERQRALDAWQAALDSHLTPRETHEALREMSFTAKRLDDWDLAVSLWEDVAHHDPPERLYPFVELAKYHEHRSKDLARALDYAQRARDLVSSGRLRTFQPRAQVLLELDHRIERLQRRIARSG